MSTTDLKTQALRLGAHLASKHGIKLKHSALLEAIAAQHGVRDWNTLEAQSRPGMVDKVSSFIRPRPKLSPSVSLSQLMESCNSSFYHLGLNTKRNEYVNLSNELMCRHGLLVGTAGQGAVTLTSFLMAQQVVKGGGLIYLDVSGDFQLLKTLQTMLEQVGRLDDLLVVGPGDTLDMDQALENNRVVYVVLPFFDQPERAQEFGNEILTQLWSSLVWKSGPAKVSATGHPFLVFVPCAHRFIREDWGNLFPRARARGVSLILQTTTLQQLYAAGHETALTTMANMWTKIFFRPASQEGRDSAQAYIVATETMPVGLRETLNEQLLELSPGDALVVCPGYLPRISCCTLEMADDIPHTHLD